jgi:hypothetical protein
MDENVDEKKWELFYGHWQHTLILRTFEQKK